MGCFYNFALKKVIPQHKVENQNIDDETPSYDISNTTTIKHIAGFYNIGSTCYMNTALKCILVNTRFVQSVLDTQNEKKNAYLLKYYNLYQQFIIIAKNIYSESKTMPNGFKNSLQDVDATFQGNHQCDCFQTIVVVLDSLHQALKKTATTPLKFITHQLSNQVAEANECNEYFTHCKSLLGSHDSIIYQNFLQESYFIYECPNCKVKQAKYEILIGLPLDIVDTQGNTTIDLYDCIKNFYSIENYSGYHCKGCDKEIIIGVKRYPKRFPPILVLQLKRYKHIAPNTNEFEKNNIAVKYPINNFDLSEYGNTLDDPGDCKYDLMAVGVHEGCLTGGHYYCLLRNHTSSRWELHDDLYTKEIKEENAFNPNAITLVYSKSGK